MKYNILFVHLLNNNTGSPRVLSNLLSQLEKDENYNISLLTSKGDGLLSNINKVNYIDNKYKWSNNRIHLSIILLISQIFQFFYVLFNKKYDCVYINTLLPFGAAFAAKLKRIPIIYHIHEYYETPNFMHKICFKVMLKTASTVIFVSNYLMEKYNLSEKYKKCVCYNSVSVEFYENAKKIQTKDLIKRHFDTKNILLISSLKKYKGVEEFINLARILPEYNFKMILSCEKSEKEKFFEGIDFPENLAFIYKPKNISEYYNDSFLCLNMSHPYGDNVWIETFGMTLIEAFCYCIPVMAPNIGGPKEIVENNINGYFIDPYETRVIADKIRYIGQNFCKYEEMAYNTIKKNAAFLPSTFYGTIYNLIMDEILRK